MKKIITRFSPESNWYLHMGHFKNIKYNSNLSKIYNGVINLRIDDTNNYKNKYKYKKNIIKDINNLNKFLDINFNKKIFYSSYKFYKIYQYSEFLLKWKIKKNFFKKKKIIKNLRKLKIGLYKEKKIIKSIFKKIIYRIKYKKHHKILWCWFLYPLYDYSHNIIDKIENITHSLCGSEFFKNKFIYNIFINLFYKFNKTIQYELKNFKLKNNIFSKSLLKKVKKKYVKNSNTSSFNLIKNILKKNKNKELFFKNKIKFKKLKSLIIKNFLLLKIKNIIKKKIMKLNNFKFIGNSLLVNKKKFIKKKNKKNKIINFKKKILLNKTNYLIYCYDIATKKGKIKNLMCKIYKKRLNNFKYPIKLHYIDNFFNFIKKLYIYNNIFNKNKISEKKEKKKVILNKLHDNKALELKLIKLKNSKFFLL